LRKNSKLFLFIQDKAAFFFLPFVAKKRKFFTPHAALPPGNSAHQRPCLALARFSKNIFLSE